MYELSAEGGMNYIAGSGLDAEGWVLSDVSVSSEVSRG